MDTAPDHLLIFKTNIGALCTNCQIHKLLDAHTEIAEWSIDPDDADCVLRIKSSTLAPAAIISLLKGIGHECAEL